jgi:small GTP-binding protein
MKSIYPESPSGTVRSGNLIASTREPAGTAKMRRMAGVATNVNLVKKICLIGDPGVGKTSLIRRFVLDLFDDNYVTTIGAKVTKKSITLAVPERDLFADLGLMIWDVSGQKDYSVFHEIYLNGMDGALVVSDLTRQNTFSSLKAVLSMASRTGTDVPMVFLMNKADLAEPSAADLKEVRTLASQSGIPVLATSARTGLNVELSFNKLGQMVLDAWLKAKDGS